MLREITRREYLQRPACPVVYRFIRIGYSSSAQVVAAISIKDMIQFTA